MESLAGGGEVKKCRLNKDVSRPHDFMQLLSVGRFAVSGSLIVDGKGPSQRAQLPFAPLPTSRVLI